MDCPSCGNDTWNNAEKVAGGWNGPLRKCKNKSCDWVQWPEKGKANKPANSQAPKWSWAELSGVYRRSLIEARKSVMGMTAVAKLTPTVADYLSAGATIFIAATRDGVKPDVQKVAPPENLPDEHEESDEMPF